MLRRQLIQHPLDSSFVILLGHIVQRQQQVPAWPGRESLGSSVHPKSLPLVTLEIWVETLSHQPWCSASNRSLYDRTVSH